jgi:excisionase family DNA binding protein
VNDSELLTLSEAAGELRCSVATVKRRIRSGALPAYRDGRLVRVRAVDLRRYVAERVTRSTPGGWGQRAGVTLRPGERLWD